MAKYRKKPVVIDAIQWDGTRECAEAIRQEFGENIQIFQDEAFVSLGCLTLEGPLAVSVGDWVIRGTKAEVYPRKPDIFATIYDEEPPHG